MTTTFLTVECTPEDLHDLYQAFDNAGLAVSIDNETFELEVEQNDTYVYFQLSEKSIAEYKSEVGWSSDVYDVAEKSWRE